MISAADVRAIELATLAAVPPRELVEDDGWLLAANAGAIGRANSATPLWAGVDPVEAKIARVVAFYRQRGLAPAVRVSPFARPEGVTTALAAAGFTADEETAVEVADVAEVVDLAGAPAHPVRVEDRPGTEWLDVFVSASHDAPDLLAKRLDTLRRAERAHYVSVSDGGRIVAVGVGVVDESGQWAGLHGMRTIPQARRRGCARAIVAAAAERAAGAGVGRMYLQVEADNAPARSLYRRVGFATAYTYAYWRAR